MKTCITCGIEKPLSEFGKLTKAKDGKRYDCFGCRRTTKEVVNLEGEEWRDVEGYEGLYQVSNLGRVKSSLRQGGGGLIKPPLNNQGYPQVVLRNKGDNKMTRVHQLVCKAFHDNPENKPMTDHIDRDRTNNKATNLRWATAKENLNNLSPAKGSISKRIYKRKDGSITETWKGIIREKSKTFKLKEDAEKWLASMVRP